MKNISTIAAVSTGCLLMLFAGLSEVSYGVRLSRLLSEEECYYSLITIFVISAKVGSIIGSLVYSILADIIGRKYTITAICVPIVISSIIFQITSEYVVGCVAHFQAGFSIGGIYSVLPVYTGEVVTEGSRGRLIAVFWPAFALGAFLIQSQILKIFGGNIEFSFTNYTSSFLGFLTTILSITILLETRRKHFVNPRSIPLNKQLELNEVQDEIYENFTNIQNHVDMEAKHSIFGKHKWLKPM
uniref:Solute carrier family 22 member 24-like n=1 Tax=Diabrotica virgifera virgifera TaxID=50390 RepID=A0A6P7G4B8_DIAVI